VDLLREGQWRELLALQSEQLMLLRKLLRHPREAGIGTRGNVR